MPLFLTLLSVVLFYFSPAEIVPSLAPYHIQQFIILPSLVLSVAAMFARRASLAWPHWFLMLGLWFAIIVSRLSKGWLRPSWIAFSLFAIMVSAYYLVSINAFTVARIRLVLIFQAFCAVVMALQSIVAYHTGYLAETLVLKHNEWDIPRIRGFGVLNDPNDFAQFLLIGLACLGVFRGRRTLVRDVMVLFVPATILIYGIYLTASRGAIFGLPVVFLVSVLGSWKKGTAYLFAGVTLTIGILGELTLGRSFSMQDGSTAGRIMAWGTGISLLRANPIFGVGWGEFTEYNSLTAHNSYVLCFAELGFFGYFFWLGLVITTVLGLEAAMRIRLETEDDVRFKQTVAVVRAALYSFLVTSWFLSRTYTETLYVLLGLGAAVIQMHRLTYPDTAPRLRGWMQKTVLAEFASIVLVYATIRLRSF